jgi:LemA protein
VFEEVTAARTRAQQAQTPAESAQAEGILSQALGRLFAVAEAYPDLKASQNFQELQRQLEGTENQIAASREGYNNSVLTYNNAIQTFPGVVLAGPFGFARREFFETDETQREAPRVDFSPGAGAAAPSVPPPAAPAAPAAPGGDAPSDPPAA